ncbi:hypothetical protein XI09_33265 [Bradyrhizobium sp. CCBAU 11386]|uniref:metallophosphoesterase n=1 Tax=Bradyrhizobium sp. CCBAU 11386 TaxID=1630837 RepID=UPI002304C5FB|nr:metallophosphoesterase [Bradyrhizobium sp. CCBAU 11386]MDA9509423.1 hypothetical protein [Bradyrhizobium sp. CCBAU 11386]
MRILPISDLHLERNDLGNVPALDPTFDVLVVAGDIWEGQPEKAVQSIVKLAQGKPAIVVLGNHDYYTTGFGDKRTLMDMNRLFREETHRQNSYAKKDLVTVLSPENPVFEVEDVRFVGVTLWTDWAQSGRWASEELPETAAASSRFIAGNWRNGVKEFGAIRTEHGHFTPYDFVAEHARNKAILLDELTGHEQGPTVVVTHHSPLPHAADIYRDYSVPWWTPAFYCSDILPMLSESLLPDLWIFGHIHAPFDAYFGRTRVVCNPFEGGQFSPNLVLEVEAPDQDDQA